MAQATISIRIDEDLKEKFNEFCEKVGMNMTTAFCMFAKDTVKNQALSFEITTKKRSRDPFWSEKNQALLRKSIKEMEDNGGKVHEVWMGEK